MRFLREIAGVGRNLLAELVVFALPVHGVDRDQEGEQPRTLDVAQELQAESLSFVRSFDDSRDVRDDKRSPVAQLHGARFWREGRGGMIRDLRLRQGNPWE